MSYPFDSTAFCRQSDLTCQHNARGCYERCLAAEGEVLAADVVACDTRSGLEARIGCLDEAVGRFGERLEGCLVQRPGRLRSFKNAQMQGALILRNEASCSDGG